VLLNAVKVTNAQGSVLDLQLDDPSGGFVVKNIEGLGPVKATLVSTSFANLDGGQYHSARREPRNIVLTLGLAPDYAVESVQDLRDRLYAYFMPKSVATMDFNLFDQFTQNISKQIKDLSIECRVESCTPSIFTKDPAMDISVMCYDPDFVDPTLVSLAGSTVTDLTETIVSYDGTVDTGVIFRLDVDRDLTDFTIYHRPPDGSLVTIDFSYPLLAGDVVEISSVRGSKYATLTRAGVESSVLYAISPQSGWLTLQSGENRIRVYATDTATPYRPIPYTIEYTSKYGGL
jgi:hypothetical protein